jgi:hypothetical protein
VTLSWNHENEKKHLLWVEKKGASNSADIPRLLILSFPDMAFVPQKPLLEPHFITAPLHLDSKAKGPHTFDDDFLKRNGIIYDAHILHYELACDAWLTQAVETGDIALVPGGMICASPEALEELKWLRLPRSAPMVGKYRLRNGIVAYEDDGTRVRTKWVGAMVLREFKNGQRWLRLSEFGAGCWWEGYAELYDGGRFKINQ